VSSRGDLRLSPQAIGSAVAGHSGLENRWLTTVWGSGPPTSECGVHKSNQKTAEPGLTGDISSMRGDLFHA